MDGGAGGCSVDRVETRALEYCHLMPMCQEEGTGGSKGAMSDIGLWVVVELLGVRQAGRGGDMENKGNDGWGIVRLAKGRGVI
jgi:hypothetical protein